MSDVTDILALPLLMPAQAQKHVTHNEALLALDVLVQLVVLDRTRNAPPALPAVGDRHIVAAPASFAWAGQEGCIALATEAGWQFHSPLPGWRAYVRAEAEVALYDGSAWRMPSEGEAAFTRLSLGASADATNRLAVATPAVLLTHVGAGVQLKLNKVAAAQTASMLFQTAWSGRAEMGTAGGEDFSVKVSPDGATWKTGLQIHAATGWVACPEGLDASGLRRNGQEVYARDNLLGTVSQSAGVPTGAVLQRGGNANGDYLRLADGTQLCWRTGLSVSAVSTASGAGFTSPTVSWSYPMAFLAGTAPVVTVQPDAGDCWASCAAPDASTVVIRACAFVSRSSPLPLRALAIGRWA